MQTTIKEGVDKIKKIMFIDTDEEIIEMIKWVIWMWFDEFDSLFEQNKSFIGRKLMHWWSIRNRYPTLSSQYDEVIGKNVKLKRIRVAESELVNLISDNKEFAKGNSKYDNLDVNYSIAKYIHLKDDAMINIAICYSEMMPWRWNQRKYWYWISIIKSETPNVFANCMSKLKFSNQ
jgi:hypothetical protein